MKHITLIVVFCMYCLPAFTQTSNKDANYVFFLHSKILEDMGEDAYSNQYGKYEYDSIVNTLSERGYILFADIRQKGTVAEHFTMSITKQIDSLMFNGVSPNRITVVGTSKGALIAMLASSYIKDKAVKFVILGMCNEFTREYFTINMYGKVLSIYEESDGVGKSCDDIIKQSEGISLFKEIPLNTGLKHGFIYKPMSDWIIPVFQWIES